MSISILERFVEEAQAEPPPEPKTPPEPPYIFGNQRRLKQVDAPRTQQKRGQSKEEFRSRVAIEMRCYMTETNPKHMLLVPAPPGSGKTWAGVDFAHWVYAQTHHRMFYAGPRRDFYADVLSTSVRQEQNLNLWYDWKARQRDDDDPEKHTCNHAENINQWLNMGYKGMDFCSRVCGWDYVNDGCPYHRQKKRTEPLIYGNHLHVTLGHPLADQFAVVVGDELPLSAFVWEWTISPSRVQLADIPIDYDLQPILFALNRLCELGISKQISGPELLDHLGGPARILESIENVEEDDFVMENVIAPHIPNNGSLENLPANYLPIFIPILKREAQAALSGQKYPSRLYVDSRGLTILTRRHINDQLKNKHMIWFDATGTASLYHEMFQRPVQTVDAEIEMTGRIYQVTDRGNGKSSLLKFGKNEKTRKNEHIPTSKADQLRAQIDIICQDYQNPGVITYKDLVEMINPKNVGHFYGSRGTNDFEDCDVLIVAGTPMPPLYEIEKIAKCLWPERMRPFDTSWITIDRTYRYTGPDGEGYAYPVSQFADPDLNILLEQGREKEIEQAAHRIRFLFRDKPVYLLTNLPIDALPPDRLLTIRELFDAPEGVDVFGWKRIIEFAERRGAVGTKDLIREFGIHRHTATKYVEILASLPGWELLAIRTGRGRPQRGAQRIE